ncbi:ExeA family protein [Desulfarculus baarsii]
MYNEFFGLTETPFAIEPNARFIVLTDDYREALATLIYAIEQQEGWAAFVGSPGVGKTTLIIALLQELSERIVPAVITNPRLEPIDFMNMVALELGLSGPFASKGQFLVAFRQLIQQCRAAGKILLLVIDEAQSITPELLEEIRLLANIDDGAPKALNIVLAGQMEMLALLGRPDSAALRQRLRHFYTLRALSLDEVRTYIRHRLRVAGGSPDIFTERAVMLVHQHSAGVPRVVNVLCDEAMLVAFAKGVRKVDEAEVREAAAGLTMLLGGATPLEPPTAEPQAEAAPQPAEAAPAQPRPQAAPPDEPPARPRPQAAPQSATPPPEPSRSRPRPAAESAPPPARMQPAPGDIWAAMDQDDEPEPTPPPRARPAASRRDRPEPRPEQNAKRPAQPRPRIKSATRAEQTPPRRTAAVRSEPGVLGRFFGSMGKDAQGGFLRRLIMLLAIVALLAAIYWFMQSGAAVRVGRFFAPYLGLGGQSAILMPEDVAAQPLGDSGAAAQRQRLEAWGPVVTYDEKAGPNG